MTFSQKFPFEKYFHFLDEYHLKLENFLNNLVLDFNYSDKLENDEIQQISKKVEHFCDKIAEEEGDPKTNWTGNFDLIPREYLYFKIYLVGRFHEKHKISL